MTDVEYDFEYGDMHEFEDKQSTCAHCGQKKARREIVNIRHEMTMSGLELVEDYSPQALCFHCGKWSDYRPDDDDDEIPF